MPEEKREELALLRSPLGIQPKIKREGVPSTPYKQTVPSSLPKGPSSFLQIDKKRPNIIR